MSGLKPDTLYYYRVQGTAANGTLYASSVMTFRTAKVIAAGPVNLASLDAGARIVAVSSNFGGGANDGSWGANSAIDGRKTTAWSTNGDGDAGFVEIALAREVRQSQLLRFLLEASAGSTWLFRRHLDVRYGCPEPVQGICASAGG